MRAGKSLSVSPPIFAGSKLWCKTATRRRSTWRAGIALLTADGVGTNEIMRRTAKSKTCVKDRSWATAMDPGEEPGRLIPD